MDRFNIITHVVTLGIAYALAFPIGWDREKEERSAVGLGVYDVAITVSILTFATLRFLAPLKSEIAPPSDSEKPKS